jgi:ribosomal protein S25
VVVDETTYNGLSATARRTIYKYDWEEELNEEKRKIKILDKRFLDKVRDEVETILRDGI